jgi:hypothetical protein
MYSLGWRKAFEANTKVSIQGISDKVKQDQLGFEDLQTHVPTINCFIGNCSQSVSQPLFDEVKKHHEELKALALHLILRGILTLSLLISPSPLAPLQTHLTWIPMLHPSALSCGFPSRRTLEILWSVIFR